MSDGGAVLYVLGGVVVIIVAVIGALTLMRRSDPKDVSFERRRLYFAAVSLTGCMLVILLAMAMFYFDCAPEGAGSTIFDRCMTIVPPIVTLVLGSYFGRAHADAENRGGNGNGGDQTASR